MKKRITALTLVTCAAMLAAGLATASHNASGASDATRDLRTTAKVTFAHTLDLGRRGPSPGDVTIFGGRLTGPDVTGRYQAYCVTISRSAQECTETLITAGGQIAAQASYGRASTALTPIVGGSGSFATARGDISERENAGGSTVHLVVHIQQ